MVAYFAKQDVYKFSPLVFTLMGVLNFSPLLFAQPFTILRGVLLIIYVYARTAHGSNCTKRIYMF